MTHAVPGHVAHYTSVVPTLCMAQIKKIRGFIDNAGGAAPVPAAAPAATSAAPALPAAEPMAAPVAAAAVPVAAAAAAGVAAAAAVPVVLQPVAPAGPPGPTPVSGRCHAPAGAALGACCIGGVWWVWE